MSEHSISINASKLFNSPEDWAECFISDDQCRCVLEDGHECLFCQTVRTIKDIQQQAHRKGRLEMAEECSEQLIDLNNIDLGFDEQGMVRSCIGEIQALIDAEKNK